MEIQGQTSKTAWPLRFGEIIFTLYIGASFLVGTAMSNWGILLAFACIYWLWKNGIPKIERMDWVLFGVFYAYYFYFAWRSLVSPFRGDELVFIRENFVFLYAPIIVLALRDLNVEKVFENISRLILPFMLIGFIWAFYEYHVLGIRRVELYTAGPLSMGMYVVASFHFSLANWRERSKLYWLGYLLAWALGLYIIICFTQSRNATGLYLISTTVFMFYAAYRADLGMKKNLVRFFCVGLFGMIGIIAMAYILTQFGFARRFEAFYQILITQEAHFDMSTFYRYRMWTSFWDNLDVVGVWGIGPDYTIGPILVTWPDTPFKQLHNDLLNLYAAGGYVGIGLYFILILWPWLYIITRKSCNSRFLYFVTILFIVMFISGLSSRIFFHQERTVWYIFMTVFAHISFHQKARIK